MTQNRSKALPIAFGLLAAVLITGFTFGLRTVIEFDPASCSIRTTRYLFVALPVSSRTEPTWISTPAGTPQNPAPAPDWKLAHEFRQTASGSKLEHTHWGSISDTIVGWAGLDLPEPARARLAGRTEELVTSDRPAGAIRVYILRVDTSIRYQLEATDTGPTADDIDAHFEKALTAPIED